MTPVDSVLYTGESPESLERSLAEAALPDPPDAAFAALLPPKPRKPDEQQAAPGVRPQDD